MIGNVWEWTADYWIYRHLPGCRRMSALRCSPEPGSVIRWAGCWTGIPLSLNNISPRNFSESTQKKGGG